jgi:hypothetical protein
MKKIIRILGLSLVVSFASCSKDEPATTTTEPVALELKGIYKYKNVLNPNPTDIDGDGTINVDIMKEVGRQCEWDNTLEFRDTELINTNKALKCSPTEQEVVTSKYIYDKSAATITVTDSNGKVLKTYLKVKIETTTTGKTLQMESLDKELNQNLTYIFVSI